MVYYLLPPAKGQLFFILLVNYVFGLGCCVK